MIASKIKERNYGGLKLLGASSPMAEGKCLLGPNLWERDKRLFDDGVKVLPKVLEAYMGETVWPPEPTRGQMARPPRALAQCGGIVA